MNSFAEEFGASVPPRDARTQSPNRVHLDVRATVAWQAGAVAGIYGNFSACNREYLLKIQ